MGNMHKGIAAVIVAGLGLALAGCVGGTGSSTDDDARAMDVQRDTTEISPSSPDAGDGTDTSATSAKRLELVTTQTEPAKGNTVWCGTMQLCWNRLMDETNSGNPVVFDDPSQQTPEVEHLNARLFDDSSLSEDHYYAYAGPMTSEAKSEIETEIAERFGQESSILEQLDGWEDPNSQLLYAMLYRRFSFATPFSVSEGTGWFGSDANDNNAMGVTYFEASDDEQRGQVKPLYYEDAAHHAVRVTTEEGDELVLVKAPEGATLDEMWQNAMGRATTAEAGETSALGDKETFKCPNLDIEMLRDDYEWVDGSFNDGEWTITQALQTMMLHLDNEGGEMRSEAGIGIVQAVEPGHQKPVRRFTYDDTFAMFIRDGNAGDDARPYAGVLVSDITRFQSKATQA